MITCTNITKTYHNGDVATQALRDIDLHVGAGEFVAVIGPSGSGKSTLMHIIGALDTPTSGTYVLDGVDVSTMTDDDLTQVRRTKIGFVFQSFNLLPRTTVMHNVMLPLLYSSLSHAERVERARRCLSHAGLEESKFFNLSNQLSGGQMQRVAIARALINDPAIILADEPTGNLDTKTTRAVMEAFRALHAQGRTIVLITHEMDVARYADRIVTLRDGVVESDQLSQQHDL